MKHSFAEDVKQLDSCDLSVFHSTTYKFLSFYSFYENTDQLVSSLCPQCDRVGDGVHMYLPATVCTYVRMCNNYVEVNSAVRVLMLVLHTCI